MEVLFLLLFFFLVFFPLNTSVSWNHFCYCLLLTLYLCYVSGIHMAFLLVQSVSFFC